MAHLKAFQESNLTEHSKTHHKPRSKEDKEPQGTIPKNRHVSEHESRRDQLAFFFLQQLREEEFKSQEAIIKFENKEISQVFYTQYLVVSLLKEI